MTKKPRRPLFKFYSILTCFLIFPFLSVFFLPGPERFSSLSIFFAAAAVNILFLISQRQRLSQTIAQVYRKRRDCLEKTELLRADLSVDLAKIESYRKKILNYSRLKELMEKLNGCVSLDETSQTISQEVNRLFGQGNNTVVLYIFHSTTGEPGILSSQRAQMQINLKSRKGDGFDQWTVKTMQPLLVEDVRKDFRFDTDRPAKNESRVIRSLISMPLMIEDKALGILRVDSPQENHFTADDLRLLTTIGGIAAISIENAQLFERAEDLASKDGLTGLSLRKYLMDRLNEEMERHLKGNKELSFLMIDLDHFKDYNDRFGHMAGDIVLRSVALILAESFQEPGNVVCRYGGEEFCVLLPECSKGRAAAQAEEFRKRIEKQTIILRRQKTRVTVSIGVAAFPSDARMRDELIHATDQAMYQAKKSGRNRVCSV